MARVQSDVVKRCFGGNLFQQGRGLTVGLELFAILRGTRDWDLAHGGSGRLLPGETNGPLAYVRRSHDFARRMPATPEDFVDGADRDALDGAGTRETLSGLVDALAVPIPGGRRSLVFKNRMLFPYVGQLIHFDAVDSKRRRGGKGEKIEDGPWISLERYTYRGAGGLAHKLLRTDPDENRLEELRTALRDLVDDSESALGQLAAALHEHDRVRPGADDDFKDEVEFESKMAAGGEIWTENLREGLRNIVSRRSLPPSKRATLAIHWVPFCIARYQLDVAYHKLGLDAPPLPIDLRSGANTIRRHAQNLLSSCPGQISEALAATAREMSLDEDNDDRRAELERIGEVQPGPSKFMGDARAFFTTTLFAVGGLNAPTGRRHFTLKLPLIETLTAAGLEQEQEVGFEDFCLSVLLERFQLVVDGPSSRAAGLESRVDIAEFDENAGAFARQLRALGQLTEYSDDTRIVHSEVRR